VSTNLCYFDNAALRFVAMSPLVPAAWLRS
jgi:hypothetical protein